MDLLHELVNTGRRIVDSWATAAQQRACHNAMVASTALAKVRAQRIGVEEFLASRLHPSEPTPEPAAEPSAAVNG